MKYYLVNYLVLQDRTVTENDVAGISLHEFANIEGFRKSIAALKKDGPGAGQIVIKSYKQISQESFDSLPVAV